MKKIVITAANGFLGASLCNHFSTNYEVIALVRNLLPNKKNITYVKWDGKTLGEWKDHLDGAHALINLAGKSVDCRYHDENKRLILQSRLDSTRILGEAIKLCVNKPKVWINSASATIYAHSLEKPNSESSHKIGEGFSVDVCQQWEKSFFDFNDLPLRQVALRTTIVLGNEGGAFPVMQKLTRWFLGGKQGKGNQMISWIHIEDFNRAVEHVLEHEEISGVINIGSPNPMRNRDFMKKLQKACNRPFGLPATKGMLEFGAKIIKTETELILKSRFIEPERLKESGFTYAFPTIDDAFTDLIKA